MRLRLFHKLFLLVAGSAVFAAIAMAVVLSINLKRGFADYLNARDDEQLRAFVDAAAAIIVERGDTSALQANAAIRQNEVTPQLSAAWIALMDEMVRRGEIPDAKPDRPFPLPRAFPRNRSNAGSDPEQREARGATDAETRRPRQRMPGAMDRPPPRRAPPDGFAIRLMLFDLQGRQILGPYPAQDMASVQQPIMVNGQRLAIATLLPRGPAPKHVDASFLQRQYRDAGLLSVLLLALASIAAYFFARSGAARLFDMQRATNAIAGGDLTARAYVTGNDEIAAVGQNINSMALNLQQLDAARRRWLAEISHELRTPLSVLLGELDALRLEIRPLTIPAVLSLSEEAQRIERIVNDLHFLALSDLSGVSCQFAPCDAINVISKITNRFAPAFAAAKIDWQLDLNGVQSLAVCWDAARITQLFNNLLSNSLRYTDAPGRVILTMHHDVRQVTMTLNDSAPGVPEADLKRVFEPLFRVDTSRARATGGSGLGLAVSQSIVAAHGGTISALLSPLGGLCMQISLPLDSSDQAANHRAATDQAQP